MATQTKPTTKAPTTSKETQECPIFLRKTYHMVDTCDPNIACWSEDGETFVVKNTDVFEKTIIPQFFRHSKFSSFVRQLNFYGFRKIKYADTIKIDAKLEAETANFWRFRHDKFQRGKPELLIEIKRSNGQQQQQQQQQQKATAPTAPEKKQDVGLLQSEVSSLKKRIEDMTKNIDDLTTLVSKVTLKQEEQTVKEEEVGAKRKKLDTPDSEIRPDGVLSSGMDWDAEAISFTPGTIFPPIPPTPQALRRDGSGSTQLSDDAFVDQLFTEFDPGEVVGLLDETPSSNPPEPSGTNTPADDTKLDPKLMTKLSDALTLLPREIQEMIVDRLVLAITSPDCLKAVSALSEASTKSNIVENGDTEEEESEVPPARTQEEKPQPEVALPLAAATLAAMLSQYSSNCKDSKRLVQQKSLPVIPIHA